MLNKREPEVYKKYVGMIFSTLPDYVKDLSTIKTFLIAKIVSKSGVKEYMKIYGKMNGDKFIPDPFYNNEEKPNDLLQNCDEVINMIINGQLSVEQKFENRKFSSFKLSQKEINQIYGKIVPIILVK